MIIYTNKDNRVDQSIQFGEHVVKFDKALKAEVKKDVADFLLEKYPDNIFTEPQRKPVIEVKEDDKTNKEDEKLQKEIVLKDEKIKSLEDEVEQLKEVSINTGLELTDDDYILIYDICKESKGKLVEVAEKTNPDDKEAWGELGHKELAIYIIKQNLNA